MWPFDYFKKKKDKEERERPLEEDAKSNKHEQRLIVNEQMKKKENQPELQSEKETITDSIIPFTFHSNQHQRYENQVPVGGLQKCGRTIIVEKNTHGCQGYLLKPGYGYIVNIYNDDLGKPTMTAKPMIVKKVLPGMMGISKIVILQGFPIKAVTPFGYKEVSNQDYGLMVSYENDGSIRVCNLEMYDRNIYIQYSKSNETDDYNDIKALFPSSELRELIKSCDVVADAFATSESLMTGGKNRVDKMVGLMSSYKNILIYLYAEEYKYGGVGEFFTKHNRDDYQKYLLCAVVMSQEDKRTECFRQVRQNWSQILQVVQAIRLMGDTKALIKMNQHLDNLTEAFEKVSNNY